MDGDGSGSETKPKFDEPKKLNTTLIGVESVRKNTPLPNRHHNTRYIYTFLLYTIQLQSTTFSETS